MSSSAPLPSINAPSPTILPAQDDLDLSTTDTFDTDSLGLSPFRALNEKNLTPRRQPPTLNDIFTSPNRVSPRSDLNTVSENGHSTHSNGTVPATDSPEIIRNPFNFQTQQYTVNKGGPMSPSRADFAVGRRRGHKYARSSISHQIILEPTPRATPLLLPTNLPIPTFKEFRASMTREQSLRWLWCLTHLAIAAYTQTLAHNSGGSLALTALSHLLFFDTLGAFLCVAVDVGRNFEVWSRSSIRHPFGLQRAEVIAGLAMAIILLFMGLDITNHGLQHFLENKGDHEPHHVHQHKVPGGEHGAHAAAGPGMMVGSESGPLLDVSAKDLLEVVRLSTSSVDLAALLAVSSTLISAFMLRNHARIGKSLKLNLPSFVPPVLRNPSHLLTLSCSGLLLLIPFLSGATYTLYDTGLGVAMAIAMITLGGRLCLSLGRMLLMSFPHGGKRDPAPHSFLSSVATPATATRATFSPTATQFTPVKANRPAFTPSTPTASAFPSNSASASLIPRILALSPEIRSIISLQLFQVHHTLCVAAVKVMLRPEYCYGLQITNDEVRDRIRGRIVTFLEEFVGPGIKPAASIVKTGKGMTPQDAADASNSYRFRWEVTVQIEVER